MWGLWLVVSNTEAQQHQQQHVSWQAANPKVIWKSSSFNEKSTVNMHLSSSSQQADFCSVQFHCKAQLAVHSWDHMLEGSAHTPLRDTRHGKMTRTSSSTCGPRDQTSLTVKGRLNSCQEVSPPKYRRWNWPCWQQERRDTVQWTIFVPGAHDFDRVFGAPNFELVLEALNFLKCLGHSGAKVPRILIVGSHKVRPFLLSQFFVLLPHSRSESGHCNFS